MKSEKVTKQAKRTYHDSCATAHALDLVGERWALLVMRELFTGPKRFSDLRAGLPGISANVLTQRLEGLEAIGVLRRRALPPPAASKVYELTEWGEESEPIFQALGRWAARSPFMDHAAPFSRASFMLSQRTMFSAERAEGLTATVGFRMGPEEFLARIGGGELDIRPAPAEGADVIVTGSSDAVAGVIYGGVPLEALEAEGALTVEGDRALFLRYAGLFPLPEVAEVG